VVAAVEAANRIRSRARSQLNITAPAAQAGKPGHSVPARRVSSLVPPPDAPARSLTVPVLTDHRVHSLPAVGQLDLIVDPATFVAKLAALRPGATSTTRERCCPISSGSTRSRRSLRSPAG
jgi:hypothetical protein